LVVLSVVVVVVVLSDFFCFPLASVEVEDVEESVVVVDFLWCFLCLCVVPVAEPAFVVS
jgi:hypothetical protein